MPHRDLHPILSAAAAGRLPEWAAVGHERRAHLARVAALLDRWAADLGLVSRDRVRWAAAGWLHDALRDADPVELASRAGHYPHSVRHGPAAAVMLREGGVEDSEVLEAVRQHSLGCPGMRRLGRFLYLADYLEPGRPFDPLERAELTARLPQDHEAVLRHVCARRIGYLVDRHVPVHPDALGFYNELVSAR